MYKVRGLRVVDASIFPYAVSQQIAPNPTVTMAAEKIADQIIEDTMMDGIRLG